MTLGDYFDDAERYFDNDCYCPNEVYDLTGFGYYLYYLDDHFTPLLVLEDVFDDTDVWVGVAKRGFLTVYVLREDNDFGKPEGTIENMQHLPINEDNWLTFRDILRGVPDEERHHLNPGEDTLENLGNLLSMSNAVMVS